MEDHRRGEAPRLLVSCFGFYVRHQVHVLVVDCVSRLLLTRSDDVLVVRALETSFSKSLDNATNLYSYVTFTYSHSISPTLSKGIMSLDQEPSLDQTRST